MVECPTLCVQQGMVMHLSDSKCGELLLPLGLKGRGMGSSIAGPVRAGNKYIL